MMILISYISMCYLLKFYFSI